MKILPPQWMDLLLCGEVFSLCSHRVFACRLRVWFECEIDEMIRIWCIFMGASAD